MPGLLALSSSTPVPLKTTNDTTTIKDLKTEINTANHRLPTIDECATHLHLLEAFALVKARVQQWGSQNDLPEAWRLYSRLAVGRFDDWLKQGPRTLEPPVDVLMVWHAFMLHPRAYSRFEGYSHTGLAEMDWQAISRRIDTATASYLGGEATAKLGGMPRDLLQLLQEREAAGQLEEVLSKATSMPDEFTLHDRDGNTAFRYDLVAALDRQSAFWAKMARYAWHRSPSAESILLQATDRYVKFFALIASHPKTVLVPTLEVDLVWHTHQLSPSTYRAYSEEVTGGRFIDHNDEIAEEELGHSFQLVEELFRATFGEEYHLCLCWECGSSRDQNSAAPKAGKTSALACEGEELHAEKSTLGLGLDLAQRQCPDCGRHPLTCCPVGLDGGPAGCGGGCGGGGGCGSCGSCGT